MQGGKTYQEQMKFDEDDVRYEKGSLDLNINFQISLIPGIFANCPCSVA